uniref:Uncharacterized protein n=1 Tax=Arundo donax TaxID=35708 RepID=A0A0A9BUH0_ARUDO
MISVTVSFSSFYAIEGVAQSLGFLGGRSFRPF